jgi:hypothetical protein
MPYYFYAISVFLSAFLLFQVQPMVGKFLLPWYGGTPTVWSTILLFSQVVLTGGYAYAYWILGRTRIRMQGTIHLIVLGGSLILLLATSLLWPSPLTPDTSWRSPGNVQPIWEILRILLVAIGIPFLVLAANSTLMQGWFHRDYPTPTPYRLYALSNIGSLLALLSYPVLIEPNLTLQTQAYLWTLIFVVFAVIAVYLAFRTLRWMQSEEGQQGKISAIDETRRPKINQLLLWIALAGCASALLIAMTNQLTQEIAVIPFLWVLPLAIYLLTFILAFAGGLLYSRVVYLIAFFIITVGSRMLLRLPTSDLLLQIIIFSLLLFVSCMLLHNELYKLRPHADYLSSFYLMVAIGGAVGGIFVTLIAPLIFSSGFWELQWGLIACGLLMVLIIIRERKPAPRKRQRKGSPKSRPLQQLLNPLVIILAILILLQIIFVINYMRAISNESLLSRRSFYGIVRVWEINEEVPALLAYQLAHGQTAHGFQFDAEEIRAVPTTYFTERSGVGLAFLNHPKRPESIRVGGLGLGIGVIASYGQEGDVFRFYEVDPDVIAIAEGEGNYFSFLEDSAADIDVIPGDARVSLEEELLRNGSNNFDMLVLDTFSGGTIPLHLLTKEAFEIYLQHLNQGGIIAVNVSNNYFDLPPAVFKIAEAFDLSSILIEDRGDGLQSYDSVWVLLAREPEALENPAIIVRRSQPLDIPENFRLWTDNFSNLFQIVK